MNKTLIPTLLIVAASPAWAQNPDMAAARTALLAPAGYTVTLACGRKLSPGIGVKVLERDGKLVAKFHGCEKELQMAAADDIKGELCSGRAFQWSYQSGDAKTPFRGTSGSCSVVVEPK